MARHDPVPQSVAAFDCSHINQSQVDLRPPRFQSGLRLVAVVRFHDRVPAVAQVLGKCITNITLSLNQKDNGRSGRHGTLISVLEPTGQKNARSRLWLPSSASQSHWA